MQIHPEHLSSDVLPGAFIGGLMGNMFLPGIGAIAGGVIGAFLGARSHADVQGGAPRNDSENGL